MRESNQAAIEFARIAVETLYDDAGDADTYSAFVTALIVHSAKIGKLHGILGMLDDIRPTIAAMLANRVG